MLFIKYIVLLDSNINSNVNSSVNSSVNSCYRFLNHYVLTFIASWIQLTLLDCCSREIVVDYYVISSKYSWYIHEIKPTKRRLIIAGRSCSSFLHHVWMSVLAYRNDPGLAATVGLTIRFYQRNWFPYARLTLVVGCSAFSRMLFSY